MVCQFLTGIPYKQTAQHSKALQNFVCHLYIFAVCLYGIESHFYTLQFAKMKNYNLNISNVMGHVNQFEVYVDGVYYFYSYNSLCCVIDSDDRIIFGRDWDYSKTTSKHLYAFLNDHYIRLNNKKDVEKAIKSGEYNEYKVIYNEALH